jgi:hypothetical protein
MILSPVGKWRVVKVVSVPSFDLWGHLSHGSDLSKLTPAKDASGRVFGFLTLAGAAFLTSILAFFPFSLAKAALALGPW